MSAKLPFMPPARPRKSREDVVAMLGKAGVIDRVALVGIRGYYHDDHSNNLRGIYDDAIFLVAPEAYVAFNANTDPSIFRRGIAKLKAGLWRYRLGTHGLSRPKSQRYTALVQADKVTVLRDGTGMDSGWFGINIHRGGYGTTSSLGCQTIVPSQWDNFIGLVRQEMGRVGAQTIPYLLTE